MVKIKRLAAAKQADNVVNLGDPDPIGRGCPKCGRYNGVRNIGRDHWASCEIHRFRWCLGSNLFSDWREETDADWAKNADHLGRFTDASF